MRGLRKRCSVSVMRFRWLLEDVFEELTPKWDAEGSGVALDSRRVFKICKADDMRVFAAASDDVEAMVRDVRESADRQAGMTFRRPNCKWCRLQRREVDMECLRRTSTKSVCADPWSPCTDRRASHGAVPSDLARELGGLPLETSIVATSRPTHSETQCVAPLHVSSDCGGGRHPPLDGGELTTLRRMQVRMPRRVCVCVSHVAVPRRGLAAVHATIGPLGGGVVASRRRPEMERGCRGHMVDVERPRRTLPNGPRCAHR